MTPQRASNDHHAIETASDDTVEAALGEHPPLVAFTTPPRVRHRRSRHHRRADYNLVAAELGQ